ncbi:MAG: DNA polymerase IV [Bacilli bacterium]|nr:DNA polymerase IV [Bacilli bacterium]
MGRVIVHIDLNAFFASVEEIKNPLLKNKPIAVGGKGRRGVVSTANYVARKYGVHSAMPISQALKLCPQLIIVEGNHEDYYRYSNEFFKLIRSYLGDKIEVASIDECYVDFSDYKAKCNDPILHLKTMQKEVSEKLGLGCSVGVSYNKFLAKMASDLKKPMGFTVIRNKDVSSLIWPLPIADMYGVGKKTAPRLIELGIKTIGDLANYDDRYTLKAVLGKNYIFYKENANGIDNSEVIYQKVDAKSIGNSTTYEKDLEDESEIRMALKALSKSVSESVISQNMLGFTVSITIRYTDFYTITRSVTLKEPICNDEEIYMKAVSLFEKNYDNRPVRLLGVTLSSLKEKKEVLQQMSIFDLNINKKTTTEIINDLNKLLEGNYLMKASEVKKDE